MELRELRTLVVVAELGSVVRAAKELHQSPSTVSHALASLETKVGTRLFTRVARGMIPTEAGEAMLAPARRALREAEAAQAAALAVEGLLAGHVSIVSLRMMTVWLADLVAAFHAEHPLVMISIRQPEREERIPDLIRSGECELGIMRVGMIPPDLTSSPVTTMTGVVLVPEGHEFASHRNLSIGSLDGADFISPSSRLDLAFDDLFRRIGIAPRVVVEADDPETIVELVRAGVGLAIVPGENVAPTVGRGAVAVPLAPDVSSLVAMASRREGELGAAAAAFVAHAVDRFAGRMG